MTRVRKTTPDKTLVIPPKKWRGAASLRGYAGHLRSCIAEADRAADTLGYGVEVRIDQKSARALLEIVCQAIHTEQGRGL